MKFDTLDARPDRRGRDNFDGFVRKEFDARAKSWASDTPGRASFESGAARIRAYLREELGRSPAPARGVGAPLGCRLREHGVGREASTSTSEVKTRSKHWEHGGEES